MSLTYVSCLRGSDTSSKLQMFLNRYETFSNNLSTAYLDSGLGIFTIEDVLSLSGLIP